MEKKLSDNIKLLYEDYRSDPKNRYNDKSLPSVEFYPNSGENFSFWFPGLKDHPALIERFEKIGLRVLFPTELSEDALSDLNDKQRIFYEVNSKCGLVFDSKETCLSGNFLFTLTEHFYSAIPIVAAVWDTNVDQTLRVKTCKYSGIKEDTNSKFFNLIETIGFPVSMEDGNVVCHSKLPYVPIFPNKTSSDIRFYMV